MRTHTLESPPRNSKATSSMAFSWSACMGMLLACLFGCGTSTPAESSELLRPSNASEPVAASVESNQESATEEGEEPQMEVATFANGCFWCTEAVFAEVKGVISAESGYIGGSVANPTYRQVCTGFTGHAEAVRVTYDANVITYPELLEIFWKTHDPTTLNRQGADVGTQYRSAIFYHNDEQKRIAEEYKQKLNDAGIWNRPIVTTLEEATEFYVAEDYHQDYYKLNSQQGYCQAVIVPKLEKFREVFANKLKTEE